MIYEVPESSGMTCAVLVLSLSTLLCSLHSFQNFRLQLGLITLCVLLLESLMLYFCPPFSQCSLSCLSFSTV